ncbi:MAG: helix-turn-helix transcriptional regulator [Desulfobulbaceae bacterium]
MNQLNQIYDEIKALNTSLAAKYLGVSEGYLRKLRSLGEGPTYTKVGNKRVIYQIRDLDQYLDTCRVVPPGMRREVA